MHRAYMHHVYMHLLESPSPLVPPLPKSFASQMHEPFHTSRIMHHASCIMREGRSQGGPKGHRLEVGALNFQYIYIILSDIVILNLFCKQAKKLSDILFFSIKSIPQITPHTTQKDQFMNTISFSALRFKADPHNQKMLFKLNSFICWLKEDEYT